MNWEDAYSLRFSGFTPNQRKYLQPDFNIHDHYWRLQNSSTTSPIKHLLNVDMNNYLPEYILRKADLCTMSHGLEMRAPLLDHHFYQSILSLPEDVRFTSPPKSLFVSHTPETATILKRKKRGFNPPLVDWLTIDLIDRFDGLGDRLNKHSSGQLSTNSCDSLVRHYQAGEHYLAEQILQLLILDESLYQLQEIC